MRSRPRKGYVLAKEWTFNKSKLTFNDMADLWPKFQKWLQGEAAAKRLAFGPIELEQVWDLWTRWRKEEGT